MKRLVTATAIAALVVVPMAAQAKHKHKHKGMEGSPNAAGFKGKTGDTGGKEDAGASGQMKGPPNANGYEKK